MSRSLACGPFVRLTVTFWDSLLPTSTILWWLSRILRREQPSSRKSKPSMMVETGKAEALSSVTRGSSPHQALGRLHHQLQPDASLFVAFRISLLCDFCWCKFHDHPACIQELPAARSDLHVCALLRYVLLRRYQLARNVAFLYHQPGSRSDRWWAVGGRDGPTQLRPLL